MKSIPLAGAAILALACAIGPAWSGETESAAGPAWLATISDQTLIAVDGSSLTLAPGRDALALTTVSPAGGAQKKLFVLMSDNLGTVADGAEPAHITGFFRVSDSGLEAQFADGHTESLTLNGAGGVTLATHAAGSITCVSWYPSGHAFSDAERRAALADYANRLGLAQPAKAHADSCAAQKAATAKEIVQAPAARNARRAIHSADANPSPILVRMSVVHPVDSDAAMPPMPGAVAWVKTAAVQDSDKAAAVAPSVGHGASDCLSVESDGANLGFRNQCGYGVQFAYCLQMESEQAASCDGGGKIGTVSANAFTPLLLGANIKASDAEHDFRWVACSGGAGEVTPHLDRADPPAGRCIRQKSS